MSNVFTQLLSREMRLLARRPSDLANPLVFFAIVIALFPLAVGPETQLLQTLSPGLIWVAALLAVLLSLDGLFRSDFEDGSLEQWVVSPHPLPLLVLAKVLATTDYASYEASGAARNKGWHQRRIDFQPYPFPSYTEELVRVLGMPDGC